MGDIRYITNFLVHPKIDGYNSEKEFERAEHEFNGSIGALEELSERIPDLPQDEKGIVGSSMKCRKAKMLVLYTNWIRFYLNNDSKIDKDGIRKILAKIELKSKHFHY